MLSTIELNRRHQPRGRHATLRDALNTRRVLHAPTMLCYNQFVYLYEYEETRDAVCPGTRKDAST